MFLEWPIVEVSAALALAAYCSALFARTRARGRRCSLLAPSAELEPGLVSSPLAPTPTGFVATATSALGPPLLELGESGRGRFSLGPDGAEAERGTTVGTMGGLFALSLREFPAATLPLAFRNNFELAPVRADDPVDTW